jgi:hypothetical protein
MLVAALCDVIQRYSLAASCKFVWELYIIFNEIVKATYIRSRAAYRLKMIARARSIPCNVKIGP